MRLIATFLSVFALVGVLALTAQAADKEVTLKGKIMCGKCALKQTKKCATVIKVNEDGKDVVYWFLDKGTKEEYHEEVCGGAVKEGTVVGTVSEKDGKKWIKPKDVKYAK
jgi:hypothetical protein